MVVEAGGEVVMMMRGCHSGGGGSRLLGRRFGVRGSVE